MNRVYEFFNHLSFETGGCWLWTRGKTTAGYAEASLNGRMVYVHKTLFEFVYGPVPEHLELDHLCPERACCNPAHLEPVTHRENVLRGESPPARLARKMFCVAGHEFTAENTIHVQGGRQCRICKRLRDRRYRERFGTRGNAQARKTHCPRGHAYDALNTYRHNGRRMCRTCMRERVRSQRAKAAEIKN